MKNKHTQAMPRYNHNNAKVVKITAKPRGISSHLHNSSAPTKAKSTSDVPQNNAIINNQNGKPNPTDAPKNKISKYTDTFIIKIAVMTAVLAVLFGIIGAYIYGHYLGESTQVINRGNVTLHVVDSTQNTENDELPQGSLPAIIQKTHQSVVTIKVSSLSYNAMTGQYIKESSGSGVIISEDGYIITNTHVVSGSNNIVVTLVDETSYTATIVASDNASDIAVIKIDVAGLQPATFGKSDDLIVGQTVIAIGNPLGQLGGTVTVGILSATDRELTINNQTMNLLQFDAAVSPGNSGGGLFDSNGALIGIVNAKSSGAEVEGLGFAIPSDDALAIATELIETGKVSGRPDLGISIAEIANITDRQAYINDEVYKFIDSTGLYVSSATDPNLFVGDKVLALDDNSVTTYSDIKNYINTKNVGDKVRITITRNKQILTLTITLTEKT